MDEQRVNREKISNENLALRVKAGDIAAAHQLWQQNRGFLALIGWRLFSGFLTRAAAAGVTWDDVQQVGYFAILAAAQGYEPDAGAKFSTYLSYHVHKEFYRLLGLQTERSRKDPLYHAGSLDEPLSKENTDGATLAEIIPDPAAADQLEDVEARIWNAQLHEALEKCLDSIDQRAADVIRRQYFGGETLTEIAADYMRSPELIRRISNNGLRQLRRPHVLCHLRDFRDEREARAYRHTGFEAWKSGGSAPERWVEWLEESSTKHLAKLLDMDVEEFCELDAT